jgi:hypothetical protein
MSMSEGWWLVLVVVFATCYYIRRNVFPENRWLQLIVERRKREYKSLSCRFCGGFEFRCTRRTMRINREDAQRLTTLFSGGHMAVFMAAIHNGSDRWSRQAARVGQDWILRPSYKMGTDILPNLKFLQRHGFHYIAFWVHDKFKRNPFWNNTDNKVFEGVRYAGPKGGFTDVPYPEHYLHSPLDLTPDHIPVLKELLTCGRRYLADLFNINGNDIAVFAHIPNQRDDCTLHVHFRYKPSLMKSIYEGIRRRNGRTVLLTELIRNLEQLEEPVRYPLFPSYCVQSKYTWHDEPWAKRVA